MVDEKQVSEIVKNVIAGMDISSFDNKPARKQLGVFDTMEEAIAACNKAYTTDRKSTRLNSSHPSSSRMPSSA